MAKLISYLTNQLAMVCHVHSFVIYAKTIGVLSDWICWKFMFVTAFCFQSKFKTRGSNSSRYTANCLIGRHINVYFGVWKTIFRIHFVIQITSINPSQWHIHVTLVSSASSHVNCISGSSQIRVQPFIERSNGFNTNNKAVCLQIWIHYQRPSGTHTFKFRFDSSFTHFVGPRVKQQNVFIVSCCIDTDI